MATRYVNTETHGFEIAQSNISSYKNYTNKPQNNRVYYFKTKEFSLIALEKADVLKAFAFKTFRSELAKE